MTIPTEFQLRAIRERVSGRDSRILRPDREDQLGELLDEIRQEHGGMDDEGLALAIALCLLTKLSRCTAGDLLRHGTALAGLAAAVPDGRSRKNFAAKRIRIALDCAIAYGCGWRRTIEPTHNFTLNELWETAFHLLCLQVADAIGVANHFFEGISRPFFQVNAADDSLESLFKMLVDDAGLIAIVLANRLIRPTHSRHCGNGEIFEIVGNLAATTGPVCTDAPRSDFARVRASTYQLAPLPAGARYIFDVLSGIALAADEERVLAAGAGGRLVVRPNDFGIVDVCFPVGLDLGRFLRLPAGVPAHVRVAVDPVELGLWECGCGNWACPERHRLASWLPNPHIGLKDFINSAVNGREYPLKPKSVIGGMYYCYLSREGWGDGAADDNMAPMPRLRWVQMVRTSQKLDPATNQPKRTQTLRNNFLIISSNSDFRPVKVVLCSACALYSKCGEPCSNCGVTLPDKPSVAWQAVRVRLGPVLARQRPGGDDPNDPPDEIDLESLMGGYLAEWQELIDSAHPANAANEGQEESAPREEQEACDAARAAFERGDLEDAASHIDYARSRGWRLPEVSR